MVTGCRYSTSAALFWNAGPSVRRGSGGASLDGRIRQPGRNVLHPYGLHPQIIYRNIGGRPGCLIFPSSDAPRQSHRTGYPAFQNSAALVEYRQPVPAGSGCLTPTGQHCLYSLLIIYADPAHLAAIVDSVQLHH